VSQLSPELKKSRAWNVSASAAATTATATATKSAEAGKQFVMTGLAAGFTTSPTAGPVLVTVNSGSTAIQRFSVPVAGSLVVNFEDGQEIVGGNGEALAAVLSAGATAAAVGSISIRGYWIGAR
jgi:hypothetical protein